MSVELSHVSLAYVAHRNSITYHKKMFLFTTQSLGDCFPVMADPYRSVVTPFN